MIQVSIRARNAASVIREIAQVPDAIVGAGMILSPDDVQIAREAGAQFCSTPGITDPLLRYFDGIEMPLLPGVVTKPTEAMHLLSRGYTTLNFVSRRVDERAGGDPQGNAPTAAADQVQRVGQHRTGRGQGLPIDAQRGSMSRLIAWPRGAH